MDFFSVWHLLILLAIVLVLFGTSKLRNMGSDVGAAIKNFKQAMKGEDGTDDAPEPPVQPPPRQKKDGGRIVEGQATRVTKISAAKSKKSRG
ncbi:MAG: twin-arginine translocase TatA/TatE family subunit [Acidiferrobacteraceae bacterium]